MKVAVQRIRDYLLSEECQLPPRQKPEGFQVVNDIPKKRVTILGKISNRLKVWLDRGM